MAKTILVAITIILIGAVIFFTRTTNAEIVENLLKESKENFGAPIKIGGVNHEQLLIDSLIANNDFIAASRLIDTSSAISTTSKHNYLGLLCMAKGEYRSGISEFTAAIEKDKSHMARNHRAAAYLKAGFLDSAILDYKEMVLYNYDFAKQLAEVYEMQGLKDSAKKYYNIYLQHYPYSLTIAARLKRL